MSIVFSPANERLYNIARRVVWFEAPEAALSDPIRFIAYAARYAHFDDMRVLREFINKEQFLEALAQAPPGIIDARSWNYWHTILDAVPVPPLPKRAFATDIAVWP